MEKKHRKTGGTWARVPRVEKGCLGKAFCAWPRNPLEFGCETNSSRVDCLLLLSKVCNKHVPNKLCKQDRRRRRGDNGADFRHLTVSEQAIKHAK
jgi:hypothetical protein